MTTQTLHPLSSPVINPIREQRRDDYLQWLYARSGRTCGTYTGLFQQRQAELLEADMQQALANK